MEVSCEFTELYWLFAGSRYGCRATNKVSINERATNIRKFNGKHLNGKGNGEVAIIEFDEQKKVFYMPRALAETFPNIHSLSFIGCSIKKITKNDLNNMKSLRCLWLGENQLTSLPGNLFHLVPNVEVVAFGSNKIAKVGRNLLDSLKYLKAVEFAGNVILDCTFDPTGALKGTKVSLEELKKQIKEKGDPADFDELLLSEFKGIMATEEFMDIKIIVDEEEFKAHRFVLAARSEAFREMFRDHPEARHFILEDIQPRIFRTILNYLYTGEMPADDDDMKAIFAAAVDFSIQPLVEFTTDKVWNKINSSNALEILILANTHNCELLKRKAFGEVQKFFKERTLKDELADDPAALIKLMNAQKEFEDNKRKHEMELKRISEEFEKTFKV